MLSGGLLAALDAEAMIALADEFENSARQLRARAAARVAAAVAAKASAARSAELARIPQAVIMYGSKAAAARRFGCTVALVELVWKRHLYAERNKKRETARKMRLGGATDASIAQVLGCHPKSVSRFLRDAKGRAESKNAAHDPRAVAAAPAAMRRRPVAGDNAGPQIQAEPARDQDLGLDQRVAGAGTLPVLPNIQPSLVDDGLPAPREAHARQPGHAEKLAGVILGDQHKAVRQRVGDKGRKPLAIWLGKARADFGEIVQRPRL